MSQVPDLLPCPFCGYKASMTNVESAASGRYMWIVGCDSEDCDVSFHGHARQIDAAKAWNSQRAITIIDEILPFYTDARTDTRSWGVLRALETVRQRIMEGRGNDSGNNDEQTIRR